MCPAPVSVGHGSAHLTVSQDRLTRMRQGAWSGHTRLDGACRTRLTWPGGFLLRDETGMPQPLATTSDGLAGGFASAERTPVSGVSLVLLVWPHGVPRIPLGRRLWRPGGPSQSALALEWLRYAGTRRRWRPESVLCAAW